MPGQEPSASEKVATFICAFDAARPGAPAQRTARRALLDTLAVAVAGRNEPASRLIVEWARARRGDRMARLWAAPDSVEEEAAALANGTAAHALDYDDVTPPLHGHPSAGIFPALVALAEARQRSVDEVVASYIAGFEISCAIGSAIVWEHYAKGWHATATIGMIGAAAACAHLLRLDHSQTTHALGIAVSHVAGTLENFGTMAKPLQAGQCAAVGLRCAVLAQLGFTAARTALDGKQGFTALYAEGRDIHAALDRLGKGAPAIIEAGIDIKKYPMCYAAHRALDGMLDLRREHGLTLDAVERIEVLGTHHAFIPLVHARPRSGVAAKFSMEYGLAAALRDGAVRLSSFDDANVMRREIQEFLPRVSVSELGGASMPRWTELNVLLKNGRHLTRHVDRLRGSAELPLSDAELIDKVADCLAFGGATLAPAALAELVLGARRLPVSELLRRL